MSELLIKGFKQLGTDNVLTLDYSGITATEESAPIINDKPLIEDTETGKVTIELTAADVKADPVGSANNALIEAKQYTDDEIAKIPTPDVSAQIGAHNTDDEAHADIRADIIAGDTAAIGTAASDATTKANKALADAKTYTDGKINALVGTGGSETLDTIGEIATAIEEHGDVIATLQPKITAGNGLTLSGTTLAVGAGTGISVAADAVGLAASGVTAGTYGPSAAVSGSNGATINVPQITVDTYGRVTSVTNRVYTSVDNNTTYSAATQSAAGLMSAADKKKLDGVATGANAYSLPTATSSVLGGVKVGSNITVSSGTISLTKANVTAALGYTPPTTDTNTDTKNTAGSTNTTSKIFLIGATSQAANPQTYSNSAVYATNGSLYATAVYGAVWNDYAEYREANTTEPGRVVCEYGDDTLKMATERLQPGASVVSDTFGFAIGETETAKTPIAVSGRVLVYPFEDRNTYQPGDAVCAAPNGTVSKMSREEIINYPERIVGTVSAVPTYETWGENNVSVNGRIWIKVR